MLNIILSGCSGKMGRVISEMVEKNDDYNYVCLRYQYKYDKSIFYRKNDGKYLIWGEEDWGIPTNALVFTDDYMIVLLKQNNYNNFKPLLSESEREKLDALSEDDNPCLLKLYFKKWYEEIFLLNIGIVCHMLVVILPENRSGTLGAVVAEEMKKNK